MEIENGGEGKKLGTAWTGPRKSKGGGQAPQIGIRREKRDTTGRKGRAFNESATAEVHQVSKLWPITGDSPIRGKDKRGKKSQGPVGDRRKWKRGSLTQIRAV